MSATEQLAAWQRETEQKALLLSGVQCIREVLFHVYEQNRQTGLSDRFKVAVRDLADWAYRAKAVGNGVVQPEDEYQHSFMLPFDEVARKP